MRSTFIGSERKRSERDLLNESSEPEQEMRKQIIKGTYMELSLYKAFSWTLWYLIQKQCWELGHSPGFTDKKMECSKDPPGSK